MHVHSGYGGGAPGGPGPQVRQPLTHPNSNVGGGQNAPYGAPSQVHLNPVSASNPGSGSVPNRTRANTISQMDTIPPALARLQHMNQDVIGGRNALTPVLNRDDAMREWERRQQGGRTAQVPAYPQLEYLQQQAEMTAIGGNAWANTIPPVVTGGHPIAQLNHVGHRYPPPQLSKLSQSYHPPPQTPSSTSAGPVILVDDEAGNNSATMRRDAILSNVRNAAAARGDGGGPQQTSSTGIYGGGSQMPLPSSMGVPSPPVTYPGPMMNRYATAYSGSSAQPQNSQQQLQNQQPNTSTGGSGGVFDSVDRRSDLGSMFVPMQPDNYRQPPSSQPQQQQQQHPLQPPHGGPGSGPRGHVISPQQIVPTSFYGAGIVPSVVPPPASQVPGQGQPGAGGGATVHRNPFTIMPVSDPSVVSSGGKPQDVRRGNGMDVWPR